MRAPFWGPDHPEWWADDPDHDPELEAQARDDMAVAAWEQDYEQR